MREHRKKLRNNMTPQEEKLWQYLKGSQFQGLKFRRQYSIGGYVIDFYCNSHKIGIEIDGNHHMREEVKNMILSERNILNPQALKSYDLGIMK